MKVSTSWRMAGSCALPRSATCRFSGSDHRRLHLSTIRSQGPQSHVAVPSQGRQAGKHMCVGHAEFTSSNEKFDEKLCVEGLLDLVDVLDPEQVCLPMEYWAGFTLCLMNSIFGEHHR